MLDAVFGLLLCSNDLFSGARENSLELFWSFHQDCYGFGGGGAWLFFGGICFLESASTIM
jgi:hypothetical protein